MRLNKKTGALIIGGIAVVAILVAGIGLFGFQQGARAERTFFLNEVQTQVGSLARTITEKTELNAALSELPTDNLEEYITKLTETSGSVSNERAKEKLNELIEKTKAFYQLTDSGDEIALYHETKNLYEMTQTTAAELTEIYNQEIKKAASELEALEDTVRDKTTD